MKFSNDWGVVEFKTAGDYNDNPVVFVSVSGIKGGNTMTGHITPSEARILAGYLIRYAEEKGA